MTTRISSDGPRTDVSVSAGAYRVTPPPGRAFSALLNNSASAVIQGAEAAAQRLPGGPTLVAAVRDGNAAAVSDAGSGSASATGHSATGYAATGPGGASASAVASPAGGGDSNIEGTLARQTQDNLYYLGLQQRIQNETRHFQALSNVMKTQHESVKNAIGNLR